MQCCRHQNKCHSIKGCKTKPLGCIWSGPVIKITFSKKCSNKKLPNHQFRKKCCLFKTKCINEKCAKKKISFKWNGQIKIKYKRHKCEWKKNI